jgi:hypothetical protein
MYPHFKVCEQYAMWKAGWFLTASTAVRQTMFSAAAIQLRAAKVFPGCLYHKQGGVIIRELLKKGCISERAYYRLADADTWDKLLETNLFAFHFGSREISFESPVMKRFCEENSALWEI